MMERNLLYFIILLMKLEQKIIINYSYMFQNKCDTMNLQQRERHLKDSGCGVEREEVMSCMTKQQRAKCHAIIHAASAGCAAVGGGLAQIPMADRFAITPVQITMTIALGRVFHVELSRSAASSQILTATGTKLGRGVSQVLVARIPGVGNAVNAVTAATVTELLGWAVAENFAKAENQHLSA